MRFFDGTNHPASATVIADQFDGAALYAGTPASLTGKDFTAAQYADYKAHGLFTILVYESQAGDFLGGALAGTQHARDLWTDCISKHVDPRDPVCATVDEHVAAANLPLAVAYQRAFRDELRALGWSGAIGVYGFPETLLACRNAGVADWYWGCGTRSAQPPYTNVWQDNTGTVVVGGAQDDIDWILIPLPAQPIPPAPSPLALIDQGDDMVFIECHDRGVQALWSGTILVAITSNTAVANPVTQFPRVEVDGPTWDALAAACAVIPAKLDAILAKLQGNSTVTVADLTGSFPLSLTASGSVTFGSPAAAKLEDGAA